MASLPSRSVVLFLLLLTSAAIGISAPTILAEINFALEALRNQDYTLFANAIVTSDLQYQLLTTASTADENDPVSPFTLFAPKDELLFALDMATDAPVYVNALRYHSVPNHRLTFADLQNLSSPFLETLLPHYVLLIGRILAGNVLIENAAVGVMVDGVRVSTPNLFLGSRIAVHGIDGILLSGLNVHQDFGGRANGTFNPARAPASSPDSSAKRPASFPHVESPAPGPDRYIPAEEMFQVDWNIPAEGLFQFDWDDIPPASAPTFHGNIPATSSPGTHQFDWDDLLESPPDENIPVVADLKMQQDIEKLKSLANKKRGTYHRKRRRLLRRYNAVGDHLLGDQ